MKFKTFVLAAVAAAPAAGWCQGHIAIGGIVDAGVRYDSGSAGGGHVTSVGSGLTNGSRLTFTGVEDLGAGIRAVFALESGLGLDTGSGVANPPGVASGPMTFGRTSMVGLGSESAGYVTLGRQYTPLFSVSSNPMSDPFIGAWLGGNSTVYSNTVRASNSIAYSYGYGPSTMLRPSPRSGLGVSVMVVPSETSGESPDGAGFQYGFALSYGQGPWWLGLGHHRVKGNDPSINPAAATSASPVLRQTTLAAAWDFGVVRVGGGFNAAINDAEGAAKVDRLGWTITAFAPLAPNQVIRALYGRMSNRAASQRDASTFQVGYQYSFSKRTSVYGAYGRVSNDALAATSLAGSVGTFAAGSTPKSVIAGVLHTF